MLEFVSGVPPSIPSPWSGGVPSKSDESPPKGHPLAINQVFVPGFHYEGNEQVVTSLPKPVERGRPCVALRC